MHSQIKISELSLVIGTKQIVDSFSTAIQAGQKIALIGDNGSGKSSLLKLLASISHGKPAEISHGADLIIGYVPQIILEYNQLSGGERFHKRLSQALANYPNLLLLDEPTNHLDSNNRKSLFNLLRHNYATQIIVSHDPELLELMDSIWHIHGGKITVYSGSYQTYLATVENKQNQLAKRVTELKQAKLEQHQALMHEQQRAKSSREMGEKNIQQRKWPTVTSKTKAMRAGTTASKNNAKLNAARQDITQQLADLWIPEILEYSFELVATAHNVPVITINHGECAYTNSKFRLTNINLNLFGNERLAIVGNNGSGKSTLIKAILKQSDINSSGEWLVPPAHKIAYFDQHYTNLPNNVTLLEYMRSISDLSDSAIRSFLNKFLFRKNEEVNNQIANLSGGERARLALATIAIQSPMLLILDEITNNIDLTTRNHILQLLKDYAGAMIVISHDQSFIAEIGVTNFYQL